MKKFRLFVAGLLALITFAGSATLAFAENNRNDNLNRNRHGLSVMLSRMNRNPNSNSIWNRISYLFNNRPSVAGDNIKDEVDGAANTNDRPVPIISNTMPVISGITAPTVLKAGETGTWTIKAFDPKNGVLSYAVDWGDTMQGPMALGLRQRVFTQESTFTHAYANAGKYVITFTVQNSAGQTTTSTINVRITGTALSAPVITSLSGPKTVVAGQKETVTVNAYDPKNGTLSYAVDWGDNSPMPMASGLLRQQIFVQTATFDHVYNLPGTYKATFTVENASGQRDSASMTITVTPPTTTDVTPPVISNIGGTVGANISTIKWTTNELSTSKVFYSTSTPIDTTSSLTPSIANNTLVTEHSLTFSGLASNTLFHYVIVSTDAAGNTATSGDLTFTTTL